MINLYNKFLYFINYFVDCYVSFKIISYDYFNYYLGHKNDIISCTLVVDKNNIDDITPFYKEYNNIDWSLLSSIYTNINNNSKILIKYIVDNEKFEIILMYKSDFNKILFNKYLEEFNINYPKIIYSDVINEQDNNIHKDITIKIKKFAGYNNDFHLFFNSNNPIKISDIFDDDYNKYIFNFFTNTGSEFSKKYNDIIYK